MTTSAPMTDKTAYFDAMYGHSDDPYALRTRWYEQRKRAVLMSALPHPRYGRAFEPGCGAAGLGPLLVDGVGEGGAGAGDLATLGEGRGAEGGAGKQRYGGGEAGADQELATLHVCLSTNLGRPGRWRPRRGGAFLDGR